MAMASAQTVCKYNQTGYCKFKSACKNLHINTICSDEGCNAESCSLRHPRKCINFSNYGYCKFGSKCAYLHSSSGNYNVDHQIQQIMLNNYELSDESDVDYDDDYYDDDYFDMFGSFGGYAFLRMMLALEDSFDGDYEKENPEFDIDSDWNLFKYNPIEIDLGHDECDYDMLLSMAEKLMELLGAWKNRKSQICFVEPGMDDDLHDAWIFDEEFEDAFDMENMYQMKKDLRMKFKRSSVITVLSNFEDEVEILEFEDTVRNIFNFVKNAIIQILEENIPYHLPAPVSSLIFTYLRAEDGLSECDFRNVIALENDDLRAKEIQASEELYVAMYAVFEYFQSLMFNTEHYVEKESDETTWENEVKQFKLNIRNVCTKFDDLKRIFIA